MFGKITRSTQANATRADAFLVLCSLFHRIRDDLLRFPTTPILYLYGVDSVYCIAHDHKNILLKSHSSLNFIRLLRVVFSSQQLRE